MYRKGEAIPAQDKSELSHSWLGRWQDVGWAIRITPRLTEAQWGQYGNQADQCWDHVALNYDPDKTLELLHALFPTHELALTWPKCTYRSTTPRAGSTPLHATCGAQAKHTEVRVIDVTGARVGIARCDEHRGQL
jgi:hypothetical protein